MRTFPTVVLAARLRMHDHWGSYSRELISQPTLHRRKMSTHALQKMTPDRFRVMSSAPRRKCPRNVVQMKEAMAAFFLAVTELQFLATVRDQKLFSSKF